MMRRIALRVSPISCLDRRAGDREEADQVLRRRQRRHVLDALVVGVAGALAVRSERALGGGVGFVVMASVSFDAVS